MEWSIAAGQAVLIAVGGEAERLDEHSKAGFENPHFIVKSGVFFMEPSNS